MEDMNIFHRQNMNGKVCFAFSGLMSDEVLKLFMDGIQMQLDKLIQHNSKARNILIIFIEVAQNVIQYQKHHMRNSYDSLYVLLIQDLKTGRLTVQSRNLVLKEEKQKITEKINYVNSLEKDELRLAYRNSRKKGNLMHSQGAGLGFLEMRKIACEDLEYEFQEYDSQHDSFLFQACV